jgi:hypothetical protein
MQWKKTVTVLAISLIAAKTLASAPYKITEKRTPCQQHSPLKKPLFGDTHVHTRYSLDASTQGTRTSPDQAYAFARGKRLGIQPWSESNQPLRSLKLSRPLDFAVVTDHAELFGEVTICNSPNLEGYNSWQCWIYREWPRAAFFMFNGKASSATGRLGFCGDDGEICRQAGSGPWKDIRQAAENAYDRSENCEFTSFVGYEWTGNSSGDMANLHRNVIFRNATVPESPLSFVDYPSAEKLWAGLDKQCLEEGKGCDVLIIPHNSNLSDGKMFSLNGPEGKPLSKDSLQKRHRFEPLVEIMQHKGSSECFFAPGQTADELCAFEQLPYDKFSGKFFSLLRSTPEAKDGFLRDILNEGLKAEQDHGVNPFQLGFIASTDTHLGAAGAAAENDFLGHGGAGQPASEDAIDSLPDDLEYNPGGLAAVWAEENSRDAIFSAMRRRETYGTSGPRMSVRFFGGWSLNDDLCQSQNYVAQAYRQSVAMGGELPAGGEGNDPSFLVSALMDPGSKNSPGTHLQRIQIIKGWVDEAGNKHQQVYDIAGNRDNGASVNTKTCERSGSGHKLLCQVWRDEAFSPAQPAYYYARVVENPSCRWSQHVCAANGVDCGNANTIKKGLEACCSDEHRPVIQERAWTSPIWYSPETNK